MSRPVSQVRAIDDPKVEPVHLLDTRASRRALDAASAHSAIRARRPFLALSGSIAALVGLALTVGAFAAPAAAGAERIEAAHVAAGGIVPLADVSGEAAGVLESVDDTVAAAQTLNAEVAASGLDLGGVPASVDTTALQGAVDELGDRRMLPALLLPELADDAASHAGEVVAQTQTLRAALTTAQQQKAADDAARAAAEQAAAEAAALASVNTVDGAKAAARDMAASRYGWGDDQFSCLQSLWNKESSWNYQAYNDSSGATGIPQALPGSKMASAGSDWQSNAATQIAWGLGYISSVYGTPCGAWSHSQATDWY